MDTGTEERMLAYCGLVCTDCKAYTATQAEDLVALEKMAAQASSEFGMEMTIADAMCDGCLATTGRQIGYCHECAVRTCAVAKNVESCAHCESYVCETIAGFATPGSEHRTRLDELHRSFGAV